MEVDEPQGWGERATLADPGTLGIVQAVQQGHFDRYRYPEVQCSTVQCSVVLFSTVRII